VKIVASRSGIGRSPAAPRTARPGIGTPAVDYQTSGNEARPSEAEIASNRSTGNLEASADQAHARAAAVEATLRASGQDVDPLTSTGPANAAPSVARPRITDALIDSARRR
jgi:hypothetical protein